MNISIKPLYEVIYEGVREKLWNKKHHDKLNEIREVLLETEFSNGENVGWGSSWLYDWELVLEDKQGTEYKFYTGWEHQNKGKPIVLKCYKVDTGGKINKKHEVDIKRLLDSRYRQEYVDELKRQIDDIEDLEEYLMGENAIGNIKRATDSTGGIKTSRYYLESIISKEQVKLLSVFVEKYGLEYEGKINTNTPGIDIIDTENNRRVLKEWVEEYRDGKYTILEFETDKVMTLGFLVRLRKLTGTTVGDSKQKQYFVEREKYLSDPRRKDMREINYIVIGENK